MNKIQLQNQINELKSKMVETQKEIDKLQKLVDKLENVRWRAEYHSVFYYYIDFNGDVDATTDLYDDVSNLRYSTGNYFRTREEAQDYKENLITKQKLKDLALKLNNGVEIDWGSGNKNYHIFYDVSIKKLGQEFEDVWIDLGEVYCLDKNFLDIAKQEIGEEALIKLIKSGV